MAHTNEPSEVFKFYAIGNDDECWPYVGNAWNSKEAATSRRPYFRAAGRRQIAYRWIYELVNGVELTPDQLIQHSCDNGGYPIGCGNPKHMSIGTHASNIKDMNERHRLGLPVSVVRAIRTLLLEGRTQQEIATLYGISRETVSALATQRTYKHVNGPGTDQE
jgi:hypothetical protein